MMNIAKPIRMTCRDEEILEMLSLRVRLASLGQLSRVFWRDAGNEARSLAKRRLRRLIEADLLLRFDATVIRLAPLTAPLLSWSPGLPMPNFGQLAWVLHRRWSASCDRMAIFIATRNAAKRFAGKRRGRIARGFQISHDLGVTEMFLAVRAVTPDLTRYWIDEDRLAPFRRGQKLPDAVISNDVMATPRSILEFGGDYGKRRLLAFHEDAKERATGYQIW
jgi:hypothetical protein